jgi:hypothetical protein
MRSLLSRDLQRHDLDVEMAGKDYFDQKPDDKV